MKKKILMISMALGLLAVLTAPMAASAAPPGVLTCLATVNGSYSITINGGAAVSVGTIK